MGSSSIFAIFSFSCCMLSFYFWVSFFFRHLALDNTQETLDRHHIKQNHKAALFFLANFGQIIAYPSGSDSMLFHPIFDDVYFDIFTLLTLMMLKLLITLFFLVFSLFLLALMLVLMFSKGKPSSKKSVFSQVGKFAARLRKPNCIPFPQVI